MNKPSTSIKTMCAGSGQHDSAALASVKRKSRPVFRRNSLLSAMAISGVLCGGAAFGAEMTASASNVGAVLAAGFNQAVAEARTQDFTNANYQHFVDVGWSATDYRCNQATMKPAYLATIPNRCAYYSRDYVHQSAGAYFLGMHEQNYQMAYHFATLFHTDILNAPYWAIGADGNQYEQNDKSPAPFELGENIANLYRLTGDSRYLGADFKNYLNGLNNQFSNTENRRYVSKDGFRMARRNHGEDATYNEFVGNDGVPASMDIVLGGDMAAAEIAYYRNVAQYPAMKTSTDTTDFAAKFTTLSANFNAHWANVGGTDHFAVAMTGQAGTDYSAQNYSKLSYYDHYAEEPNLFPLFKGIITDPTKLAAQANYVDDNAERMYQIRAANDPNHGLDSPGIESHTYLPTAFYNANKPDIAWKWLTRLAARQSLDRGSAYPEVSFVLISDIITRLLGVDFDGPGNKLVTAATLPSAFKAGDFVKVSNIPIHTRSYTVNIGVSQGLDANGSMSTRLDFQQDPSAQAKGVVQWTPRFRTVNGNHCLVTKTYKAKSPWSSTFSLLYDAASNTYSCNAPWGIFWLPAHDGSVTMTSTTVTVVP